MPSNASYVYIVGWSRAPGNDLLPSGEGKLSRL